MSSEFIRMPPRIVVPPQPVVEMPPEPQPPGEMISSDPVKAQAADATFSRYEEKAGVMDVLSAYALGMWVADFAKETLRPSPLAAEESEPESGAEGEPG